MGAELYGRRMIHVLGRNFRTSSTPPVHPNNLGPTKRSQKFVLLLE